MVQKRTGKYTGQHYQRHHKCVGNLYAADVRKDVGDDANVDWLHCSVPSFVFVVDYVVNDTTFLL